MKTFYFSLLIGCFLFHLPQDSLGQTDANIPIQGITIYIDYPDAPASVTPLQLDSLLNGVSYQETGVPRTFRTYWYDQTRRNIVFNHDIFFYTAPLNSTHYDTIGWQNGIQMWKDALEWVIVNYPNYDWNALSTSPDNGALSSVMIISSKFSPAGVGAAHYPRWTLSNGKEIRSIYGSVLQAPWDNSLNMFMTLHESGHGVFRFPDTYDTDYDSGGNSFYTLMSGGKNDVEPIGGPFLVEKNWGHVLELGPGTHTLTLRADGDSVLVFRNLHDSLEYFSLEVRKQSTLGNSLFPAPLGLLIWHTDTKVSTSNRLQNMTSMQHYRHSVEQADGLFELEGSVNNNGNIGDVYLPGDSFTHTTIPDTKWWDGTASHFGVDQIQLIGSDKISFQVTVPQPHADHFPVISHTAWSLISATPPQNGYEGEMAFDDDPSTYYHVPWGNSHPRPHEMVIDLGQNYTLNEFFYRANTNQSPPWEGRIENYELYLSMDNQNWGAPVASGTFFYTGIRQYVLFPAQTARYLKFSALNTFNNDVRTSIAELDVRGAVPVEISAPQAGHLFRVFPNPAKTEITIETSYPHEMDLEIYDLNGKRIKAATVFQRLRIPVTDLPAGLYVLKARAPGLEKVVKFVKQ